MGFFNYKEVVNILPYGRIVSHILHGTYVYKNKQFTVYLKLKFSWVGVLYFYLLNLVILPQHLFSILQSEWLGWNISQIMAVQTPSALAGMAQWTGRWPVKQKVTHRLHSRSGHTHGLRAWSPGGVKPEATDQCISHTLMFVSLSFSLPSPVSKSK